MLVYFKEKLKVIAPVIPIIFKRLNSLFKYYKIFGQSFGIVKQAAPNFD